jgi:putative ABC transport system permease protein
MTLNRSILGNYLKVTFRNLSRNKTFSFITIFGLGLSMSICLLVLLRLKDQLGYDTFHPHTARSYRIITDITNQQGNHFRLATTPLPLVNTLKKDYNFIASSARLYSAKAAAVTGNKKQLSLHSAFTEPGFFDLFGFTLRQGDKNTALRQPNSIVLSHDAAVKFFGAANAMGKYVSFDKLGNFVVTGILNKLPGKSHIDFEAYLSMSSVPVLESSGQLPAALDEWNNITACYTYVLLKEGSSETQITHAVEKLSGDIRKASTLKGKENIWFDVQPLSKIILGEELQYSMGNTGSRSKAWAEIAIAFIILLSACFNYTNLSVARSLKRGKEVGIRKVAGAFRSHIFMQFITESACVAFLSLGIAYVLLQLITDYAPFAGEMIPAGATIDAALLGWFILFTVFTGLLAGILPAWALSSFKPVEVLKNLSNIRLFGGNRFRKVLTVAQFALSLFIVIFTLIFSRQFNYMANADQGYNNENVISIPLQGTDYHLLSNKLSQLHGVEMVSAVSDNLGGNTSGKVKVQLQPGDQGIGMDYYDTDAQFVANMKLSLLAGQSLSSNTVAGGEQYAMINEAALRSLKMRGASEAVNKQLWLDDSTQVRITGVLKDFYFRGMETPVTPLIIRNRESNYHFLHVRTTTRADKTFIASAEQVWKSINPEQPFAYTRLKDALYEKQTAGSTVSMLGFLGFMSVTLACLGLLGMVIYTTETRKKEIGIRKVMGAGVAAIMYLLSKGFIRLVLIAALVAIPLSYVTGYLFLNMFANRIRIGFIIPAAGFLGLLCIVLLTIGAQVYRAAIANPVKNLRTE